MTHRQTLTYWNPETLLDITSSWKTEGVQCVGYAKTRGGRCGWEHRDSYARDIRSQLVQLAAKPPAQVTLDDLERLAKACLCSDWHYGQYPTVSRRWYTILARAREQYIQSTQQGSQNGNQPHSQATSQASTLVEASNQEMDRLLLERKQCAEILGAENEALAKDVDLFGLVKAYHLRSSNAQRESGEIITQLREELATAQADLASAQSRLQTVETELERAKRTQAELSEQHRAAVFRAEESRKSERARLTELAKMVETASHERGKLETMVALLRAELEAAARASEDEKRKASEAKREANDLERLLAEALDKLEGAYRSVEEEKRQAKEAKDEVDGLERLLKEALQKLEDAYRSVDEGRNKTKELEEKVETLGRQLSDAERLLEEGRIVAENFEQEAEAMRRQLPDLNREKERSATLEAEVEGPRCQLSDAKLFEEDARNLETQLSQSKVEADRLRKEGEIRAKELQDMNASLERKLAEETAKGVSRAAELCKLNDENESLRNTIASLERQLAEARAKEQDTAAELDELSQDHESLRQAHASALDQVRNLQADLRTEREVARLVNRGRSATEATLQRAQTGLRHVRAANERLALERSALEARILALEAEASGRWRNRLRAFVRKLKPHPVGA